MVPMSVFPLHLVFSSSQYLGINFHIYVPPQHYLIKYLHYSKGV